MSTFLVPLQMQDHAVPSVVGAYCQLFNRNVKLKIALIKNCLNPHYSQIAEAVRKKLEDSYNILKVFIFSHILLTIFSQCESPCEQNFPALCLTKADDLGNLFTIYSHFWSYFLRKMGFFLEENSSMKKTLQKREF